MEIFFWGNIKCFLVFYIPVTTIEEAFPYDVPDFVPPILMVLSTHINDCQVSKMTISGKLVYIYAS